MRSLRVLSSLLVASTALAACSGADSVQPPAFKTDEVASNDARLSAQATTTLLALESGLVAAHLDDPSLFTQAGGVGQIATKVREHLGGRMSAQRCFANSSYESDGTTATMTTDFRNGCVLSGVTLKGPIRLSLSRESGSGVVATVLLQGFVVGKHALSGQVELRNIQADGSHELVARVRANGGQAIDFAGKGTRTDGPSVRIDGEGAVLGDAAVGAQEGWACAPWLGQSITVTGAERGLAECLPHAGMTVARSLVSCEKGTERQVTPTSTALRFTTEASAEGKGNATFTSGDTMTSTQGEGTSQPFTPVAIAEAAGCL